MQQPTRHHSLHTYTIMWCCVLMLSSTACARDELARAHDEEIDAPSWILSEVLTTGPVAQDSPLVGDWIGPGQVGGCISVGSWQRYAANGSFTQVNYDDNACLEPEDRYTVSCEGAWVPQSLETTYEKSGELLHACRTEAPHPSQPQERYVESTFALLDRGDGWQELSTMAWLWQADGTMRRQQSIELTYPASPSFPEPERSATQIEAILSLHEDDEFGPRIMSMEDFDSTLFAGASRTYTLVIDMTAQGNFSTFGVSEQGSERVVLLVDIRKVDDFLVMEAQLEGDSDFLAWSTYLQDQGINRRYAVLGGVFSLAFSRTLYLDVRAPVAWAAPGSWVRVEELCDFYQDELRRVCEGS